MICKYNLLCSVFSELRHSLGMFQEHGKLLVFTYGPIAYL